MGLNDAREVSAEQLAYARWIDLGTRVGLAAVVLAFAAYLAGFSDPLVPMAELPRVWSLPVGDYLARTGLATGWGWIAHVGHADIRNIAAVALLSLVTVAGYLRLVAAYVVRGDRLYAALAVAEIVVLVAAVSGLVAGH